MAYDEELANRVRELMSGEPGLTEKKMFGGLAMLLDGNMAVAIRGKGGLLLRIDPAQYEKALGEIGADEFEMRGKALPGWIAVDASGCAKATDLRRWVKRGVAAARSLPPR